MIQGKLRILAIATASFAPAVFAGVTFTENFMNYAERAPGVTLSDDWITVQYDPIWQRSGFIDVRPKGVANLYGQPIALAKGRFDLAFDYVYLNSTLPAEAKKDKPAVAADWGYFDVVFTDGAKEQSVRVAADAVAGACRAKPVPNHIWWKFGVVGRGQKLEIYSTASRRFEKVADVALPFVPTGFNIRVADGKWFRLSNIRVTDGDGLPKYPASASFADFRALQQPLAGAKAAAKDEVLDLTPAPRAGVRFVLGSTNATATLSVKWSDGQETRHDITVRGFTNRCPGPLFGEPAGSKQECRDAMIRIAGVQDQYVRPSMGLYQSLGEIVPPGVDILREWDALPPASQHALAMDLVRAGDRVQVWLDGSFVATLNPPRREKDAPEQTVVSAQIRFDEGVRYVRRSFPKTDPTFLKLDFAAYPRAKAFADATLVGVKPGETTIGGYPMTVARPMDSADVSICHEALGNFAMECEAYHGRSPSEGLPSAVHYRLPTAPYGRAGVLFALDPDPKKDAILTLRIGVYMRGGSGSNMSAGRTYDFSKGVPDWCKKVGEVKLGGRTVPLYFGDFELDFGPIVDLMAKFDYLDFDIAGKQGENLQQLDNRAKPAPDSDSAFNLFGCTLQLAPYAFDVVEETAGNVYTEDEKVRRMTLRTKAYVPNAKGTIKWTIRDVEGKEVSSVSKDLAFAKAGDTKDLVVDFGAKTPRGFYTCDIDVRNEKGAQIFAHQARFAVLPDAKRMVSAKDSPFATWWFDAHGSPGDEMLGFPVITKAGIRKSSWRKISREDVKKWGVLPVGYTYAPWQRSFEKDEKTGKWQFKAQTIRVPDPNDPKKTVERTISGEEAFVESVQKTIRDRDGWADHMMVWHEGGPSIGVPEELLGLPVPQLEPWRWATGEYINEIGRIARKHFPQLKIQIGNASCSMGAATWPLRAGANPDYYDCIGIETPSQIVPPERRIESGLLGMLASQDVASRYAKRKVALSGTWEFVYRDTRDMGEELQAEWHARDVLICLAHDFFLISPGILFDCTSGYHNTYSGGPGLLLRGPTVYPKRAYVAYAVATKVLDGVKFVRELPTGSSTVYAMEYKRMDGKTVTALWCARGEVDFDVTQSGKGALQTEMYGRETQLKDGVVRVRAGGRPVYLTTDKPLVGVKIVGRAFAADEALAAKAKVASPLASADGITLKPDADITSKGHPFFPVMIPGEFTLKAVTDEKMGPCLEVSLDLEKNKDRSPYYTEFTTLRFAKPIPVEGMPELIGLRVKGDSNWGQIRFEITDAKGEVFKNRSTGRGWGCDIMDWPGNLAVNFDGWSYVYTALRKTDLIPTHSPGSVNDQWMSCGGDKVIDYPISISAITVGMNRCQTSIFSFLKNPGPASIRIKDVGTIGR